MEKTHVDIFAKCNTRHLFCLCFDYFGLKSLTNLELEKRVNSQCPILFCFFDSVSSKEAICTFKPMVWERVWGVRPGCKWSHNTPTANNTEVKRLALPIQTHTPQMTTSLWKETASVCVIVCCQWRGVGWGGVVIWVSSREWNKCSKGDSLPYRDRRIVLTKSVTIWRKACQNVPVCLNWKIFIRLYVDDTHLFCEDLLLHDDLVDGAGANPATASLRPTRHPDMSHFIKLFNEQNRKLPVPNEAFYSFTCEEVTLTVSKLTWFFNK